MLIKAQSVTTGTGARLSLRCPGCLQIGVFEPFANVHDVFVQGAAPVWLGSRRCPNHTCLTHVFAVSNLQGVVVISYPAQRIEFDPKAIPGRIVKTLDEALSCHAHGLYVAAAMMIRRTLEELCEDKKAVGGNLKERITALQSAVVLPNELFLALDDLRLLGNDAAHIEAKTYDAIGREELEVGIELTKEVLKAVYQLDTLLGRLRALKKT